MNFLPRAPADIRVAPLTGTNEEARVAGSMQSEVRPDLVFRQRDADHYDEVGRIKTVSGARPGFFSAELDKLYLAVRSMNLGLRRFWFNRQNSKRNYIRLAIQTIATTPINRTRPRGRTELALLQ